MTSSDNRVQQQLQTRYRQHVETMINAKAGSDSLSGKLPEILKEAEYIMIPQHVRSI
jgi:hypothetical protein